MFSENNKTDYTYANSWSYRKTLPLNRLDDWKIPNMSRSRLRQTKETYLDESNASFESIVNEQNSITSQNKVDSSRQLFLRSDCLGGQYCRKLICLKKRVRFH